MVEEITAPAVDRMVIKNEFLKNVAKVIPPKPFQPVA